MHQLSLLRALTTKADVRTARLVRLEARTRTYLTIKLLSRKPNLNVIGLCGSRTHVTRAEQHRPIMQTQLLQYRLGIRRQLLVFSVALFRAGEFHQLDFLE